MEILERNLEIGLKPPVHLYNFAGFNGLIEQKKKTAINLSSAFVVFRLGFVERYLKVALKRDTT